jgi:hypothetical protein
MIFDINDDRINGCRQRITEQQMGVNYPYPCPALKDKMIVQFGSRDLITVVIGGQTMHSDRKAGCVDLGWKWIRGVEVCTFIFSCALEANQVVGEKCALLFQMRRWQKTVRG